jgi:hypothetical protein
MAEVATMSSMLLADVKLDIPPPAVTVHQPAGKRRYCAVLIGCFVARGEKAETARVEN